MSLQTAARLRAMARALILEAEALEAKERPQPRKIDRKHLENLKPRGKK
jgi:hypothetical protein